MYYRSKNPEILKAEKCALKNEWLEAAEIWNNQTKNKNSWIAAKATFNMALACEMESKPDAATDWLVKFYAILKHKNEGHKANCKRYIEALTQRKKEIERLRKQVRNQE